MYDQFAQMLSQPDVQQAMQQRFLQMLNGPDEATRKRRALGDALLQFGNAMSTTPGNALTGLSAGVNAGAQGYAAGMRPSQQEGKDFATMLDKLVNIGKAADLRNYQQGRVEAQKYGVDRRYDSTTRGQDIASGDRRYSTDRNYDVRVRGQDVASEDRKRGQDIRAKTGGRVGVTGDPVKRVLEIEDAKRKIYKDTIGSLDTLASEEERSAAQTRYQQEVARLEAQIAAAQGAAQPAPQQAAPGLPQVGGIVNGYRYKGGDPKNPASWEKVQ